MPTPRALVPLAALAALLSGCAATVVGGGGEGGGEDGAGVTTGSPTGGPTGGGTPASAIALFEAEHLAAGGLAHCEEDRCASADMLFLIASSEGSSCADPDARPGFGDAVWVVHVGLPVEHQRVGTFDLTQTGDSVYLAHGETESNENSGAVMATGGFEFGSGTLEIVALDATTVTFRMEGVLFGDDSDGEYVAPRCGGASPPGGG